MMDLSGFFTRLFYKVSSSVGSLPTKIPRLGGVGKVTIFSTPIANVKNSVVEKVDDFARPINRKNRFVKRLGN